MTHDNFSKKCDACGLFLKVSDFYRNKSKNDGYQNKCKDCIKDYKFNKKNENTKVIDIIKKDFYYIPDIFLIGYGRMQTYQHCCLHCNCAFFCFSKEKEKIDLFCEECSEFEFETAEKNISNINYFGNVVGWMAKLESPLKKRNYRNYKKVYIRDCYTCQYCGYNMSNAKEFLPLHIDHIKPWSAQGGNSMNNLVVSCQRCNLFVSNKWFESFDDKKNYILSNLNKQQKGII